MTRLGFKLTTPPLERTKTVHALHTSASVVQTVPRSANSKQLYRYQLLTLKAVSLPLRNYEVTSVVITFRKSLYVSDNALLAPCMSLAKYIALQINNKLTGRLRF